MFIVKNDHKPLQKLFGSNSTIPENCSARLQRRWALRLFQFQCKVEYIEGSENVNGDFLSRFPNRMYIISHFGWKYIY